MAFITKDFLLENRTAGRLYNEYAAEQPIFDYHCHLSPKDIAENRRFRNLFEIWLEGDHYKWRAMRANGIAEHYCTGNIDPYEKFLAWARTVPYTLRNPLYHWTHLELLRYFGIDELLDESAAPRIWHQANEQLNSNSFSVHGILDKFRVRVLCTTDDPLDSLQYHAQIRSSSLATQVFPAFRPDRALQTQHPTMFNQWTDALAAVANIDISRFPDFLDALGKRHDFFHEQGCRLSDHGLDYCYLDECTESQAKMVFEKVRKGQTPAPAESEQFASFMLLFFGRMDAQRGWTKQLHLGAYRNINSRMYGTLGPNTGFDAIGDWPQARALARYLDRLDQEHMLPKMVVYNLNPADNYIFATMTGSFTEAGVPGKIQFGTGWWFLDQKEGIEAQLNALSNCGLLSRFVGMLTDSRSFMSYPRHEYFRRILCNILGQEMEKGYLPNDKELIGQMVRNICFDNAMAYFDLPSVQANSEPPVATRP